MNKLVTIHVKHESGITLESLRTSRIKGVYTSTVAMITSYFVAYSGIWGCQALEITKSDYKLLVGVLELPELNV
ncbi:hypothetical protein [Companilactobacillus muriivasis]|uniref:hypothetical protein n=1 Tax=Companilactobacillus muriivasis TaxID=3081444 RepID=UPI0030C67D59